MGLFRRRLRDPQFRLEHRPARARQHVKLSLISRLSMNRRKLGLMKEVDPEGMAEISAGLAAVDDRALDAATAAFREAFDPTDVYDLPATFRAEAAAEAVYLE